MVLNGRKDLVCVSVEMDDVTLSAGADFELSPKTLTILKPPSKAFTLRIVTEVEPAKNTSLDGLYKSSGTFCTQVSHSVPQVCPA